MNIMIRTRSLLDGNKCGDNLYILAMMLNAWSAKTQRMVCNVADRSAIGLQWSADRSAMVCRSVCK